LNIHDIDEQIVELLNKLPQNTNFFNEITNTNQSNSTSFKDDLKKFLMQKINNSNSPKQTLSSHQNKSNKPGPDELKLKEIIDRTGYKTEVTVGQRKYGGPPPDWQGSTPGNGCEVFIGKLPKDCFEDILVPIFEQYGKLWDLRVMIDSSTGYTKGYAFVTYCDRENARQAANKVLYY
jgi:heterogeneous nuclear ribonucleoprotein R